MLPPSSGPKNKPVNQVSGLTYSSTLRMEATYSSETSIDFQWTTWCYILDDTTLHLTLNVGGHIPEWEILDFDVSKRLHLRTGD
jgi:hypothetical protein